MDLRVFTDIMNDVQERAQGGTTWLDEVWPGWRGEISDEPLEMSEPCGCVLGQIAQWNSGGDCDYFSLVSDGGFVQRRDPIPTSLLPLAMSNEEAISRGLTGRRLWVGRGQPGYEEQQLEWSALNEAWRREARR